MVKKYPYLKDINFLNKIYGQHNQACYVLITVLDWQERALKEIQGKVISASISVNGDSTVRRTANLSIKIKDESELYNKTDSLFDINRKIFLETGLKNNFAHLGQRYYSNYKTIWFPFGVFIIQNYSITHDVTGVTLSLTLGDKMCLLNGDAGGTIPASVNFESVDKLGPDGDLHSEWIRINQLIPELVNHFGGEDLNKILVNDIDDKIKQVLKWRGTNDLFLFMDKTNPKNSFYTTINAPKDLDGVLYDKKLIQYNYDAGYTYTDFVYPGELTASAGDSVCTVLDKIKNTLGNYEYYYDIFGNFIFQEIKNYVNVTEWRTMFQDRLMDNDYYLPYVYNKALNSSVYNFDSSDFVISYNNNPQFNMIKNDFIVWGVRTNALGQQLPCRYHLAIDERPKLLEPLVNTGIPICFDLSMYDKIKRCYPIKGIKNSLDDLKKDVPQGVTGEYYYVTGGGVNSSDEGVYTWISNIREYKNMIINYENAAENLSIESMQAQLEESAQETEVEAGYLKMPYATYYPADSFVIPIDTNWRNILYFQGVFAEGHTGIDPGYYWTELCNEWPKIYDIEYGAFDNETNRHIAPGKFLDGVLDTPTGLDWWLDIIDNDSNLNKFSVQAIGRRSYAKTDEKCNCVFEPDIPDIVMINTSDDDIDIDSRSGYTKSKLAELGLIPIQVADIVYTALVPGGTFNSCYQHIRQIITNYTDYNESISMTCLPIYHLEPNTRISINDPRSGIYGDYVINTISYTLGSGNTMSITAKKCIEKI